MGLAQGHRKWQNWSLNPTPGPFPLYYNRNILFLWIYSPHSTFTHRLLVPRSNNISKALGNNSRTKMRFSDCPMACAEEGKIKYTAS